MLGLKLNHVSKRGHSSSMMARVPMPTVITSWYKELPYTRRCPKHITSYKNHQKMSYTWPPHLAYTFTLIWWSPDHGQIDDTESHVLMELLKDTQNFGLCMRRKCRDHFLFNVSEEQNVPGIPGACTTRNFVYLTRGPWKITIIVSDREVQFRLRVLVIQFLFL